MIRNVEDLALDEITEDFLREQLIAMGRELGVDTRQGSIYRDAGEGHIRRTKKFFEDLRQVSTIISLETCTGEVLDQKLLERGLSRNPTQATPARYYCMFTGRTPSEGDLLTCGGHEFHVESVDERVVIVSTETGSPMNNLLPGTPVIPDVDADGLVSCTLQELAEPALDPEDDDSARDRLLNRIAGQDENANKSQVRTWCESVEGVGSARIIPLWDGANTVKGIIISASGDVPSADVVSAVQDYIDPGSEGMGEGMAPIGLIFTAAAAEAVAVNVSVNVVLSSGTSSNDVKEILEEVVGRYCAETALADWSAESKIRYNRVSAMVTDVPGVLDHAGLTLNSGTANISLSIGEIPVLGEVEVIEGDPGEES